MKIKNIFSLVIILNLSGAVYGNCFGTANSYQCKDLASGNSYNVQKYGNSTNMQGYNAGTGSAWTQNSQTFGNTTMIQGNANGNTWNQTIQTMPGMTTYSGTDSRGNYFNKTCTALGCF